ncbi:hypothetical protein A1OE_1334 [Candidatus Endolissoclinum faulkneri L2]|uniref:Uncharacterized protein n=1 Tax=Candidatus Endolissoclinum faulkneri L2 TaxID=1193729 RepID=K7YPQ9_9PROT|nr:hypothetical protein A1OE_1334 [Candidatus Endolissoclinum faulkneri L2]
MFSKKMQYSVLCSVTDVYRFVLFAFVFIKNTLPILLGYLIYRKCINYANA